MAVQVWVGEKPEHPNERRAIVALANGLERLDGLYLILANFSVGGNSLDMVIVKSDAVFILELKHCDGKVFGGVNGAWHVESANGERKRLNPGRKNPYNQVIAYFYALTNFLNSHRREFLSQHKSNNVDFRTCRRVVVIAPTIPAGSQIELDWKVELKGLDELPTYLVTERSSEIDLTAEEMQALPQLLHLTRWTEVNSLIAGVLPNWETVPSSSEELAQQIAQAAARQEAPAAAEPSGWGERLAQALRTGSGRIVVALSILVSVLALAWLLRPTAEALPQPDQPALVNVPVASPGLGNSNAGEAACVWEGFQPVGKRWEESSQRWVSVGVEGDGSAVAPDVVITLDQVSYCSDEIVLTWTVRNNGTREIALPLRSDNISIQDIFGNEYLIHDASSEPRELLVAPGELATGQAIVSRPLSRNASALLIRLKEEPFGEASWLVSLRS
jgi:hypothetical protein